MTSLQFYKPLWYLQRLQPGRPLLLKEEGEKQTVNVLTLLTLLNWANKKKPSYFPLNPGRLFNRDLQWFMIQ